MAEVKFCGLTRREDAREARRLGALYLGGIFAGGPRNLDASRARALFDSTSSGAQRVGVFGAAPAESIAATAHAAGVNIIQLHGDPDADAVCAVRACFPGPIWAVVRVAGDVLPSVAADLFATADAVVLDARSDKGLGGTGVVLPWGRLREDVQAARSRARLVVAGGLTPANVAEAIEALSPDVVDVSSGVESAPGIKDHSLMSAFMEAARSSPRAA